MLSINVVKINITKVISSTTNKILNDTILYYKNKNVSFNFLDINKYNEFIHNMNS